MNDFNGRHQGYFVDLFVRTTNHIAIGMYEQFGYSVYRRVLEYYHTSSKSEDKNKNNDAYGRSKKFTANCRYEEGYETRQVETEREREWAGFSCHPRRSRFLIHIGY